MDMPWTARWLWRVAALSASIAEGEVRQVILPAAHVRVQLAAAPHELSFARHVVFPSFPYRSRR
jgi:hypothetical protein